MATCVLKLTRRHDLIGFRPVFREKLKNPALPYDFLVCESEIETLLEKGSVISKDLTSFLDMSLEDSKQTVSAQFWWLDTDGEKVKGGVRSPKLTFPTSTLKSLLEAPVGTQVNVLIKPTYPKTKINIMPCAVQEIRKIAANKSLRRKLGKTLQKSLVNNWFDEVTIERDVNDQFYFRCFRRGEYCGNGGIVLTNGEFRIHT